MARLQRWKQPRSMDFITAPLPKNGLRDVKRYRGLVVAKGKAKETAEIAREMVEGGWCSLRPDAVEHVLSCLGTYMKEAIRKDGCRRTITGLASFFPSMEGEFETPHSPFDPGKHRFVLRATATKNFANGLKNLVAYGDNVTEKADEEIVSVCCEAEPRSGAGRSKGPVPIVGQNTVIVAGKGLLPVAGREDEGVFLYSLDKKRKLADFEILEGSTGSVLKLRLKTLPDNKGLRCQICIQTRGGKVATSDLHRLFHRVAYYGE